MMYQKVLFYCYFDEVIIETFFIFTEMSVPQFICMGRINSSEDKFHPNGYVCSGELDFVLSSHDPCILLYQDECIRLFDKPFVFEEAFLSDTDLLLNLAR